MRLLRAFKALLCNRSVASLCGVVVLVLASLVLNAVVNYNRVYPTPDTQSGFLKYYLPAEVIARFDEHWGSTRGDGKSSGAGRGFASHSRTIDFGFATRPANAPLIAKALRDDAVLALRGAKMQVLDQSETSEGEYRLHYAGGKTEGTVVIEPVVADDTVRRRMPLPAGIEDVTAEIRIEETWLKE